MAEEPTTEQSDAPPHSDNVSKADEVPASTIQDGQGPAKVYDDDDDELSLTAEFLLFLKEEKKWWLAPLVIVLLGLGAIIVFAEGSAIAPFIYTIF